MMKKTLSSLAIAAALPFAGVAEEYEDIMVEAGQTVTLAELQVDRGVTLRKIGDGTLRLTGGKVDAPLRVEAGTVQVPYFQPVSFRHYRFVVVEGAGAGRNSIALSEFRLLAPAVDGNFADVTANRSGFTFGEGANDRDDPKLRQGVSSLFDGDMSTKWLTMKTGAYDASETDKSNCWVQLDFAAPQAVAFYDFSTTDDSFDVKNTKCRLPLKWRFLGSDDGETWTVVDERTIDTARVYRKWEWIGPYGVGDASSFVPSAGPSFGFNAPLTLAGGLWDVDWPVRCVGLAQAGGLVKVGEHGSLSLVDALWTAPEFTEDSSGSIEVVGDNRSTIAADSPVAFKGDVIVRSGRLLVGSLVPHATSDRLFRFTVKNTYSDKACTQLSGLRLLDESGNVLSRGLVAAAAGTDPAQLPAGACCYPENYSQGGSSKVEYLFDENTSTKMCLTNLRMGNADYTANTWRTVYFRLPADQTAAVAGYQLTTANDQTPARNPSIWSLESSSDGVVWTVVDERQPGDFENPTKTLTDFNGGTPFVLHSICAVVVALSFPDGKGFSVLDGAELEVGDGQSVEGLFGEGRVVGGPLVQTFEAVVGSSGLTVEGTLAIAESPVFRLVGFPAEFDGAGPEHGVTVTVAAANGFAGAENLAHAKFSGLPSVARGAAKAMAFVDGGKLKVTVYLVKPGLVLLLR